MSDVIPQDRDAERALLGGVMLTGAQGFDRVAHQVGAGDFHSPAHGAVWAAFETLRGTGRPLADLYGLSDELRRQGSQWTNADLLDVLSVGTANIGSVAATVVRCSTARRVLGAALDVARTAREAATEPQELLDEARAVFAGIDGPKTANGDVDGLDTVDAFVDRVSETEEAPWLIPGLLRQGWRVLIVAPEGHGKSMCLRAIAVGAAQGIAPFGGHTFPPVRTLIVDAENPEDIIRSTCRPIRAHAKLSVAEYDEYRAWIWHRPGGINLRTRRDRIEFESVLAACRPDVVCAGPLYKLYRPGARENDELAAGECQNALDDMRARHRFALVLEHHAPKAQGGTRELLPYGSSLWLRWPELGPKLIPSRDIKGSLAVKRWRPDRVECQWPDRLDRGERGRWPWVGRWENGMPTVAPVRAPRLAAPVPSDDEF